jgi:hypothetical protein
MIGRRLCVSVRHITLSDENFAEFFFSKKTREIFLKDMSSIKKTDLNQISL